MPPALGLRLVTYLLVCNGVASLLLAGLIGPLGAGLVVLAMLASWWLERARERGVVRAWMARALIGTAAVAIAMDLVYLASTALDGMVHLLLFLILARLFMRRSLRDLRDAGFLSFFLLVATSSVTFSVGFVLVFTTLRAAGHVDAHAPPHRRGDRARRRRGGRRLRVARGFPGPPGARQPGRRRRHLRHHRRPLLRDSSRRSGDAAAAQPSSPGW